MYTIVKVMLPLLLCAGDAIINGLSVKNDMTAIRQDLGVCPQFDILWPEITVKEHLMLYAAIKGFGRQQQLDEATSAAHDVGEYALLTLMLLSATCVGVSCQICRDIASNTCCVQLACSSQLD